MNDSQNGAALKDVVRREYGAIALQSREQNESSCCGAGVSCGVDYTIFSEDYSQLNGYNSDADLGLGCGLPTAFAQIRAGNTVVDLGSGAGNDAFVARAIVGENGRVIGIDMTPAMLEKARANAAKYGFENVEFRDGDIENLPLEDAVADVVISNCVLNLVPDKARAFGEIFRVLKAGAHFCVSDVVLRGELPAPIQSAAEMYAGCVSGAIQKDEYLQLIDNAGFAKVSVQSEKEVVLPDEVLREYLDAAAIAEFRRSGTAILSVTVSGQKSA